MSSARDLARPACNQHATLLITRTVTGTSTSVARLRLVLRCAQPLGHLGPHLDPEHEEKWEAEAGAHPTLLRQEEDPI